MEKISLDEFIKLPKDSLKGKIIIFPTDTVYGVACLLDDTTGINKIYEMKKRDYGKPIAVLCSSLEQVNDIAIINDNARKLFKFWPGALTLIFNKKNSNSTIALRIPDSDICKKLLDHFGPMHTTSVNYSGEKEINDVNEICNTFGNYVDYVITDYQKFSSVPSTIVNATLDDMVILRQGSVVIDK